MEPSQGWQVLWTPWQVSTGTLRGGLWHQLHVSDEANEPRPEHALVTKPEPEPGGRRGGQQSGG